MAADPVEGVILLTFYDIRIWGTWGCAAINACHLFESIDMKDNSNSLWRRMKPEEHELSSAGFMHCVK